ncbi:MAG: sensor histidine kinase [Ilumatobacteraceae bacterium]
MPTMAEIAETQAHLDDDTVEHLGALLSEWGMLADFSFADLLLYLPIRGESATNWVIAAQVRAATGQTLHHLDLVGEKADDDERPLLAAALADGQIHKGEIHISGLSDPASMTAIPVRFDDRVVAVLTRETSTVTSRRPGQLERAYLEIFDEFARMIAAGLFPFHGRVADASVAPRVGDGVLLLDAQARVSYASPNAVSAVHRVGIRANAIGQSLAELGFADSPVRNSFERREPVVEELDERHDVTLLVRSIPILRHANGGSEVTGGVLLLRDVSELRRRDRLILTKDATIREIHHRVKNNLQTISSLLRLQARRLESDEAKAALADSVRRIRTIALVHETLSREPGEDVSFTEIVRPLLQLTQESLQSTDRPVSFAVRGDGGRLPATIATPLSVVILELLQNGVDHAFAEGSGGGRVLVELHRDDDNDDNLHVRVIDDGRGVPADFNLAKANGLGLSIVRTLVTTELGGHIAMRRATADELAAAGFDAAGSGTIIDLVVPAHERD